MKLSSATLTAVTEKPSIIEDIDYELGTDSTSFPLADKLRLINKWCVKAGLRIWKASSSWKFDDSNATTLPYATQNLVNNQRDYAIPTTALSIEMVQVMDTSGAYITLERRDVEKFPFPIGNESTGGMPTYWDIEGNSIIFDIKVSSDNVTLTNGLRVFISRNVTKFTTTDANTEPGFIEPFHDYIVKGVCYDFARIKGLSAERITLLRTDMKDLEKDMDEYYANRDIQSPRVKRKFVSYS